MNIGKQGGADGIVFDRVRKLIDDGSATIHFIGVGGVSMYSLARLCMTLGALVMGSDREESAHTREIRLLGARITIGHSAENVRGADLVVYTHAIAEDNPELVEAKRLNILTVNRAQLLGALMGSYGRRIGVLGSHGKSTTVAMLDCIFSHARCNPTTLSGADLPIGEPLRIGGESLLIYEACEYKDSFLSFSPTVSVALNLELDHTDYFDSLEAIKTSFKKALGRSEGLSIINGDDMNLKDIADGLDGRVVTFGGGEQNDYRYSITSFLERGFEFSISRFGSVIGNFVLNIPGVFNVNNATAAICAALEYGIDKDTVAEAIASFRGIPRRLEYIGSRFGRPIYYDYAHHPTEITASINALKAVARGPLTVIFRPHTFSRTMALWREFVGSLSFSDHLVLCDIFPAREEAIEGITSERLAYEIGSRAKYCTDNEILEYIDLHTEGAIVLMGAGDLEKIKKDIVRVK